MSKTVVSSDNAPAAIGPYSPGIQTGNIALFDKSKNGISNRCRPAGK